MAETPHGSKTPLWLTLAWRETFANKAFSAGFILNLSLGLLGCLTIAAFKDSLHQHLTESSQVLAGADLVVSGSRPITDEEIATVRQFLPIGSTLRRETELMSMVALGDHGSRLVELRAVDKDFPYYAVPKLRKLGPLTPDSPRDITSRKQVWMAPELLTQLGGKLGDSLKIGAQEFLIADVMEHDPTAGSTGLQLAPTVYLGLQNLADTGLLAKGSRVGQSLLVRLPPGIDAEPLVKPLKQALGVSDLRVRSHANATQELNRALVYLNDYLGLVAQVALFLAGVGGAYLFRSFLAKRARDIAILLSLGMPVTSVRLLYAAQLFFLGSIASIGAAALAKFVLPLLPKALGSLIPTGMTLHMTLESFAAIFALGTLGSLLFALPLLVRLGEIKPLTLFQEASHQTFARSSKLSETIVSWLPAMVAYWLMAMVQARSFQVGTLFMGIFLACLLLLALFGFFLVFTLNKRPSTPSLIVDMATVNLARHPRATVTSFVALGLGTLLICLVPAIRSIIRSEIEEPQGSHRPSLFLFDIQPEQQQDLEAELARANFKLSFASPMIRARLTAINGQNLPTENPKTVTTREDEEERRAMSRGYNLSYRAALADSEDLVIGRQFHGVYGGQGPAEMSLETKFASRLGLTLGDHMTFEVQGVTVEGVIVNLRRVHWTSFQPNFFVQFQPGVLDDAPKTIVAAISGVSTEQKASLQTTLVRAFPNVSIIDVTATIERLLGIVKQMSLAIYLMAFLTLVAGMAVLLAIAHEGGQRRVPDVTLMRILGANTRSLTFTSLLEFGLLSFAAAALGALLSIGATYALSWYLFDRLWVFDGNTLFLLGGSVTILSTLLSVLAISRSLKAKPAILLGEARFG